MCAAVPSPELVDRVRDLYQKRVSDVRFLIPVLNGLSKVDIAVLYSACELRHSRGKVATDSSVAESVVYLTCSFVQLMTWLIARRKKLWLHCRS